MEEDLRVIRIKGKDYVLPHKDGRGLQILAVTQHPTDPNEAHIWRVNEERTKIETRIAKLENGKLTERDLTKVYAFMDPVSPGWHFGIRNKEDRGKGLGKILEKMITGIEHEKGEKKIFFPKWDEKRVPKKVREHFLRDFKQSEYEWAMVAPLEKIRKRPVGKIPKVHWFGLNPRKLKENLLKKVRMPKKVRKLKKVMKPVL